ncbi:MAG: N-acetylglucosamine-6-phosphate deacetylase, partial [Actinobacteria bacterium]|nr:N-acetylglucosamine-6-phosphate deacetylase [Actinomycetota bacterium]
MSEARDLTLLGARVVTPAGVVDGGWVRVRGSTVAAVGGPEAPPEPAGEILDLRGTWLLPGFIDIHMHGGGGHDVAASPDSMRAAVDFHREYGTTRTLVSLVAAPADALVEQLAWIGELAARGVVLGAHLEGPFLARSRCGAQNPTYLVEPDLALFD